MLGAIGGWFTPTILFCFMNLMIATIFLSYKKPTPDPDPTRPLTRATSLLDRARSFKFNLYNNDPTQDQNPTHLLSRAPSLLNFDLYSEPRDENPTHHPDQAPSLLKVPDPDTRHESPTLLAQTTLTMLDRLWCNTNTRKPDPDFKKTDVAGFPFRRTELNEVHTRKPDPVVRLSKSASEKMKSAEKEVLRRPATVREKPAEAVEEDEEVDEKFDDFIHKFRQQLKLQRLGSLLRFNEMLKRGA